MQHEGLDVIFETRRREVLWVCVCMCGFRGCLVDLETRECSVTVTWQGAGWLGKGLLQLGGSFLGPSGGEVERLRDLVQCARVLMRDEDTKRESLSLQRHRLSFQQADVAVTAR